MSTSAKSLLPTFAATRNAWREVVAEEWPIWLHAARTIIAMLLALGIAFRLDLSSPSSAAVTVGVISLPQSGMVLEKSFYRLLATICGGLVTLLLVGIFAQQRDLFIAAVALWIGICAACSAWFRNFQSYGWALAGYTACLIGFPAYEHADRVFDIFVDRVSIVALGVLCGGIVNATLFPNSSANTLVASVRRSFRDFVDMIQSTLNGYASQRELHATQRQFLHDIVALESARASSFFEDPNSRIRTPRLRRFISQYMVVSTTAHALNRLRDNFAARSSHAVLDALRPLHAVFIDALHRSDGAPPAMAVEAGAIVKQLNGVLGQWEIHSEAAHTRLPDHGGDGTYIELENALVVLRELIEESRDFAETYAELYNAHSPLDRLATAAPVARADRVTAMIAGMRAALTLTVICEFWILTDWPDGFIATLLGGVICTLFASAQTPTVAIGQMTKGFGLGLIAAVICFTFVLPRLDGMLLLIAGLTPFLMIGGYLMARPQTAGIGSGFFMMFLVSLGITEIMHYDIVALLGGGLAQIVGVSVAALAFTVIFPTGTNWHTRRVEKTLWRELLIARGAPLPGVRHRFESGVRDLALQFINLKDNDDERRQRLLAVMTLLEVGRALISLRELLRDERLHPHDVNINALIDAAVAALTLAPTANAVNLLNAVELDIQTQCTALATTLLPQHIAARAALQLLALAIDERKNQLADDPLLNTEEIDHAART